MERLNSLQRRTIGLALALLAAGIVIQAVPRPKLSDKTEAWMETKAPLKVGDYIFTPVPGSPKPNQSYEVDERTYEELTPFGIVDRVYVKDNNDGFDVLLIASNKKTSFHDNRICFTSQGFQITEQKGVNIQTDRGLVPVTFLTMQHNEYGTRRAVMFYKGPHGKFFPLPQPLALSMFWEEFRLGTDLDSVFYRIMPKDDCTDEQLIEFTKEYLKASNASSGGFF